LARDRLASRAMTAARVSLSCLVLGLIAAALVLSWPNSDAIVEWTASDVETTTAPSDALEQTGDPLREAIEATPDVRPPLEDELNESADHLLTLRGRVVDAAGAPVAGAQVAIELRSSRNRDARVRRQATTGRNGEFAMRGPLRGAQSIAVLATHDAFAPSLVDRELRDQPDATVVIGDVVLGLGGSLRGTVVNSDGAPLPGATVELAPESGNRVFWSPNARALFPPAQTGAGGEFAFTRVPPGLLRVQARAPRHLNGHSESVMLRPGEALALPPLALAPGCALVASVRDAQGQPVAAAQTTLHALAQRGANRHGSTGTDGRVAFDHLPPGPYELHVRGAGHRSWRQIVEPCRTPQLDVVVEAGLQLRGRVRSSEGRAVTMFAVRARRLRDLPPGANSALAGLDIPTLQAQLAAAVQRTATGDLAAARDVIDLEAALTHASANARPQLRDWPEHLRSPPQNLGAATAHADGEFTCAGLDEGVYVVEVKAEGAQATRSDQLELRHGAPAPQLEIVLQPGRSVAGQIVASHDRAPIAKARVEVLLLPPDATSAQQLRAASAGQTLTDAAGHFTVRDVPPGRVAVRAFATGHGSATSEPFTLQTDRDGVTLALDAHARLTGVVLDLPAESAGNAVVVAFSGPRQTTTQRVDAGRFAFPDLHPGEFRVRAYLGTPGDAVRRMHQGAASAHEVVVQLGAGEVRDIEVRLTPVAVGSVRGVARCNGQPGVGLHLSLSSRTGERSARGNGVTAEADGSFAFAEIEVGSYELVIASVARERIEVARQAVDVSAGHETRVTADVAIASLAGEVVTPEGENAGDGVLRVWLNRPSAPEGVETEAGARFHPVRVRSGRYRVDVLPAGEHFVEVRVGTDRKPNGQRVRVDAGEQRTERLVAGPRSEPGPGSNGGK
jgi:protocatechuate 3,4-dioxygenase beta subunit